MTQKYYVLCLLVILNVSLFSLPVYAERIISVEKTLPTESTKLMQVISDLEVYPQILPENIKSSTILNGEGNLAKMSFNLEFISIDADIKYLSISPNEVVLEVVSGDLKGTKFTGILSEIKDSQGNEATLVNASLDLKISWYLSLITNFISDENIKSMLNTALQEFSNYANNPQPAQTIDSENEKTCFLFWCW